MCGSSAQLFKSSGAFNVPHALEIGVQDVVELAKGVPDVSLEFKRDIIVVLLIANSRCKRDNMGWLVCEQAKI